jgi:hypothetical protein
MISPELATAIGGAAAAVVAAFAGGNSGGKNSLNGFKEEVRAGFTGVNERLDEVIETQGAHDARLDILERESEPVA